ncbi:uncharacterized protein LOC143232807 isoform X2 [Tachypleus tridentatus]|uniref:uncharacterized protein LOC143232807 isoform X2 n=1 Tax=Tachypleus tridentatus TaxID=6853 RepID=UPI003FD0BD04
MDTCLVLTQVGTGEVNLIASSVEKMDTCHESVLTQVGTGEVNLVGSSMVKMDTTHETVQIQTNKLDVMVNEPCVSIWKRRVSCTIFSWSMVLLLVTALVVGVIFYRISIETVLYFTLSGNQTLTSMVSLTTSVCIMTFNLDVLSVVKMNTCHETVLTQVGTGEVNLIASSMVKMDTTHETVQILTNKLDVMVNEPCVSIWKRRVSCTIFSWYMVLLLVTALVGGVIFYRISIETVLYFTLRGNQTLTSMVSLTTSVCIMTFNLDVLSVVKMNTCHETVLM